MTANRCRQLGAQERKELIEISTLIDLTDKPIGLTRDQIGWSTIRATASNCICCCNNNSITLVTTNDSYILDHIPLDNIQLAQTNHNLQYLALSNDRKLVIIELADEHKDEQSSKCATCGTCNQSSNKLSNTETKVVNLASQGLTMNDIVFWRWIDNFHIALLSQDALYTCSLNQQHINHPAYTAFSQRSRYLSLERIFEAHEYLSAFSQVTDIQRDSSGNLFAISSLYSTSSLRELDANNNNNNNNINNVSQEPIQMTSSTNDFISIRNSKAQLGSLKPSFGSMPSRLSQLANNDHSLDSLDSEHSLEGARRLPLAGNLRRSNSNSNNHNNDHGHELDQVCGLIQVHCRLRNRSQLIQAHAISFTNPHPLSSEHCETLRNPTILVAANKIGEQMRVHFIEMATSESDLSSPFGQNTSPSVRLNRFQNCDFPTSIVFSYLSPSSQKTENNYLHLALITTKHGQLFVCSVAHSTILFNTSITNDIISSTVLESNTQSLMAICRNGQVLLIKLKLTKLLKLLDETKTLRHISSSHNLCINNNSNTIDSISGSSQDANTDHIDVIISTRL